MITWSAWTDPFDVPGGPLDVYQSLQCLAVGSCVAAHFHDGPENGLVVGGIVTRWEADAGERRLAAGTCFVTPAAVTHATGNWSAASAEQITLHILPRAAAFAHPCTCVGFPPGAPGSTSRARVCFAVEALGAQVRTRHAMLVINGKFSVPTSSDAMFLTVVEGSLAIAGRRLSANEGSHITGGSGVTPTSGPGCLILTEIRQPL